MMQIVILAGGLGTRMLPMTEELPKALLPVAGRPFCDWQLSWLAGQGALDVVLCTGHLGGMLEEHVGDGNSFGLSVTYVREGEELRGTAGALRLAADHGALAEFFAVVYGDSYLTLSLDLVERAFLNRGTTGLMTVLRNEGRWDRSNAVVADGFVVRYDKSGADSVGMNYIDYGLTVMRHDVVTDAVPSGATADLAPILGELSRRRQLAAFEATEPFYEVGSAEGLRDLERYLTTGQGRR